MSKKTKAVVKFGIALLVMTVAATILWGHVAERLYDCTDDCGAGFLTPGSWVHRSDGRDIVSVSTIVHGRSMTEPDTILQGWTIKNLWALWGLFAAVTLGVSTLVVWAPWGNWNIKTT
jgi:hypothetical protein